MIKFNKPETIRKALTATVMTVGLLSPVFGNVEANYSFGGDSAGGGGKCYQQVLRNCSAGGGFTIGMAIAPGGILVPTITVATGSVTGQRIACKGRNNGSKTCESRNCANITFNAPPKLNCN
jgi:hypothetical protein